MEKAKGCLKKKEYSYVFDKAEQFKIKELLFLYRRNDLGYARLGLAIAKKNVAHAVERNYIKRVVRDTFRKSKLPAIDVVVLSRSYLRHGVKEIALYSKSIKAWDKLSTLCKE